LPLARRDGVGGAFCIGSAGPEGFDDDEVRLFTELADDLSYGVGTLSARLAREDNLSRLQSSMEATILALAATVEVRDPYTAGHQRRVAQLAMAIARELGVAADRARGLYLAAVCHDVGKICVPSDILTKPGGLTAIEFELIKTHVQAGYEILRPIDFPWPIAEIVYQHHERLDGSGYPRSLKGEAIMPESRILAVADVVEAITSHRPYRPSLGLEYALGEIRAGRGTSFDAEAVDACVRLLEVPGGADQIWKTSRS
jgi:putative nucleotidyltransferase with HDIG domain